MAKTFAPRVSKRQRTTIDMSERLAKDYFKNSDEKLLKGAKLDEINLNKITIKEQVRTKFNDASIAELAKNIQINGLIQPLVIHREGTNYRLICGERRYRAMSSIKMDKAPCFVLEDKSEEELMAIQFSENSSREELHYVDRADGIYNYQIATNASERKIKTALGISKSEVHRSLLIAKMDNDLKEAAKQFNIEKYVLLEFDALGKSNFKNEIAQLIKKGEVVKRSQLKSILKNGIISNRPEKKQLASTKKKETTASKPKQSTTKKTRAKKSNLTTIFSKRGRGVTKNQEIAEQ